MQNRSQMPIWKIIFYCLGAILALILIGFLASLFQGAS